MTQSLFLDPTLSLEKVAYDTRIDDDPDEWPIAVVRESYKQLPFLKTYETEVELDKVDNARGYGVGKLLVWPARMEKSAAAEGKQLVTVPIIIRNSEMAPLDVYSHKGKMLPMDQDKVAQVLFRPETFEGSAPRGQFSGTNLFGQLTPPNTDHQMNAGGLQKSSSTGGMYGELLHTFRAEDKYAFAEKLASVQGLRQAFTTSPLLRAAVADMAEASEKTASDVNAERQGTLRPTVVQITQAGSKGYTIKTASHRAWAPVTQHASRFDVQKMLSPEGFDALLDTGSVTYTTEATNEEACTVKTAQPVTRAGVYRTYSGGTPVEGLVIPHMVDFDGKDLDTQVFFGEDRHSLQDKVAGVHVRDQVIRSDAPRGLGVFIYQEGDRALATEPVRIEYTAKVAHEMGTYTDLVATRMSTGAKVRISMVPGLQKIANIGGTEIAIPTTVRFLSLNGRQRPVSSVVEDVHLFEHNKTASAGVELVSDGSCYSLRGRNARDAFDREILTERETAFALCGLGLTGTQAADAMKTAAAKSSMVIPNTRPVFTIESRGARALEKAASVVSAAEAVPRVDLTTELALLTAPKATALWKEASVILSRETTDAILSLGFVTPENASLYVNYLPELEKVSGKLAELLVASRLGLDDVRESSAKNAMTQVNAVVRGLETMRDRIN